MAGSTENRGAQDYFPGGLAPEAVFRSKLMKAVPELGEVVFTDNRRRMVSAKKNPDGSLSVRLQHAFRAASGPELDMLARFIRKPDAESRRAISAFLDSHQTLLASLASQPRPKKPDMYSLTAPRNRNLAAIMAKVKADYGLDVKDVYISYGNNHTGRIGQGYIRMPGGRRARSRSMVFGSYSAAEKLIRIHPLLDGLDIPEYFVEYVVYHELLHEVCRPVAQGCRRLVHTDEFRRRERLFARYDDAKAFEKEWMGKGR